MRRKRLKRWDVKVELAALVMALLAAVSWARVASLWVVAGALAVVLIYNRVPGWDLTKDPVEHWIAVGVVFLLVEAARRDD